MTDKQQRPSSAATSAPEKGGLEAFRISCLMNSRYHATREAFLDTVHRWLMFGVILFGAGAIGELIRVFGLPSWFPGTFGAAAAVFGALDLTFDLSNRARAHTLMKRRYFELLADVKAEKTSLAEAEACLHRYCADEEPPYHALMLASWNAAQEMEYGDNADQYDIPKWDRYWQNIWRFEGKTYPLTVPKVSSSFAGAKAPSPTAYA